MKDQPKIKKRILSVGFAPGTLALRSFALRQAGHVVEEATDLLEAWEKFMHGNYDLVLLCYTIDDTTRGNFSRELVRAKRSVRVCNVDLPRTAAA